MKIWSLPNDESWRTNWQSIVAHQAIDLFPSSSTMQASASLFLLSQIKKDGYYYSFFSSLYRLPGPPPRRGTHFQKTPHPIGADYYISESSNWISCVNVLNQCGGRGRYCKPKLTAVLLCWVDEINQPVCLILTRLAQSTTITGAPAVVKRTENRLVYLLLWWIAWQALSTLEWPVHSFNENQSWCSQSYPTSILC